MEEAQDSLGLRIEKVELFPNVADELDETRTIMNLPAQVEMGRLKQNETGEILPDKGAIIYLREVGGEGAHWIAANPSRYLRDNRGLVIGGQADADYCVGKGYLAAFVCYLGKNED